MALLYADNSAIIDVFERLKSDSTFDPIVRLKRFLEQTNCRLLFSEENFYELTNVHSEPERSQRRRTIKTMLNDEIPVSFARSRYEMMREERKFLKCGLIPEGIEHTIRLDVNLVRAAAMSRLKNRVASPSSSEYRLLKNWEDRISYRKNWFQEMWTRNGTDRLGRFSADRAILHPSIDLFRVVLQDDTLSPENLKMFIQFRRNFISIDAFLREYCYFIKVSVNGKLSNKKRSIVTDTQHVIEATYATTFLTTDKAQKAQVEAITPWVSLLTVEDVLK